MRSPRGGSARRAGLAAAALLAGCASQAWDTAEVRPIAPPAADARASDVLMRVLGPPTIAGTAVSVHSELWDMGAGRRLGVPGHFTLSPEAFQAGWRHNAALPPGRYFLRLQTPGGRRAAPMDLAFTVPSPPPPVLYIGSFHVECPGEGACRFVSPPVDDSAAARALVSPPPVTRIAQPYPMSLVALGLPPPTSPAIVVDARQWLAAIDWSAFGAAGGAPRPAPGAPRSDAAPLDFRGMASTSGGRAVNLGRVDLGDLGRGIALPIALGALVVLGPIAVIRHAREAAEAERTAAALIVEAQERWGPCGASIAATLEPGNVERHLRSALPERAAARRGATPPVAWQASVTRVVFRRCLGAPDSYGVEVATRWTALRAGEAEPAYDAAFSRTVVAAAPDPGLVHASRLPFELRPATEAACRPIEQWCAPGGSALLLQEVTRGVTEARDAIVAGR